MLAIIKIAAVSVCLGTVLCMTAFFARADSIRPCVLRLHVLANSDSPEDQELKLKVRDRLLECGSALFCSADSLCDAERRCGLRRQENGGCVKRRTAGCCVQRLKISHRI